MDRLTLERRQVWIYLAAIIGGLSLGTLVPGAAPRFETLLWPVLASLLYATFVQVPLLHVREAFRDARFVLAILLGNFIFIPLLVWLAIQCLPIDPALPSDESRGMNPQLSARTRILPERTPSPLQPPPFSRGDRGAVLSLIASGASVQGSGTRLGPSQDQ